VIVFRIGIISLATLLAGCDRDDTPELSNSTVAASERLGFAQQSLERTQMTLAEFQRMDLITKATREFLVLRRVELSDEKIDWRTQRDLADAKSRAEAVLPKLAQFEPMLLKIDEALLDLRGSINRVAQANDLDPESRAAIRRCGLLMGELRDDLNFSLQVLIVPATVFPHESYIHDPDFKGALETVEAVLRQAQSRVHEGGDSGGGQPTVDF